MKKCILLLRKRIDTEEVETNQTRTAYREKIVKIITIYVAELETRFNEKSLKPIICLYEILMNTKRPLFSLLNELKIYSHFLDFTHLDAEMNIFYQYKIELGIENLKLSDLTKKFVELDCKKVFPQIYNVFSLYLSIPVSSATAERSFSCLKRTKTWLRSTISQDRLSALAVLNIEADYISKIDIENVINIFASSKTRRIPFI